MRPVFPVWTAALILGLEATAAAQETIALDRWLVSTPFPADTAGDPLLPEYLSGPGESGVLPERGREAGGAEWTLVRRDSTRSFDFDGILEERPSRAVTYAHAYVRAPEDRTVRLVWGGLACTRLELWFNGRPVQLESARPSPSEGSEPAGVESRAAVRLGFGWNTVLIKAASGTCPYGWEARFEAPAPGALEGIRVQASRPPGEIRTGPAPWVVVENAAGPTRSLTWSREQVLGSVRILLTAWSATPVDSVELKAKAGGAEGRGTERWLTPGAADSVLIPFELSRLVRALRETPSVRLEVRWAEEKAQRDLTLDPATLLEALHARITMAGWGKVAASGDPVAGAPADRSEPLARRGETWTGTWKVPGSLSGFTLALDVAEAPGEYRINGRVAEPEGGLLPLCVECEKGASLAISAVATGDWARLPAARVLDPGYPSRAASGDVPSPADWAAELDESGNRGYRELGRRFAAKDSGKVQAR